MLRGTNAQRTASSPVTVTGSGVREGFTDEVTADFEARALAGVEREKRSVDLCGRLANMSKG